MAGKKSDNVEKVKTRRLEIGEREGERMKLKQAMQMRRVLLSELQLICALCLIIVSLNHPDL